MGFPSDSYVVGQLHASFTCRQCSGLFDFGGRARIRAMAFAGEHEFERSEFARREERVGARSVDALGNVLLRRLV